MIVDKAEEANRAAAIRSDLYRLSAELLGKQARFGAAGSSDYSAHGQSQIPHDGG